MNYNTPYPLEAYKNFHLPSPLLMQSTTRW